MSRKIADFWRGYIKALSDEKFSTSVIAKRCKDAGINISRPAVIKIIAELKKSGNPVKFSAEKLHRNRNRPSRQPVRLREVRRLALQENPPTQKAMARKTGTSVATVNRIIHQDLRLKKFHKARVHALNERHIRERKTNARKLYERHLSGDKWKFIVTLDEAWVYLTDCGKIRAIGYRPVEEKGRAQWVRKCRENFPKGFMVVAGYSYRGRLQIRRVAKNTKINARYYQENVLKPLFETEIPALYGPDQRKVHIHQDKASSHTARTTQDYCRRMQEQTGIQTIPYSEIPVKSPDASPMDFCGFGLLKSGLGKQRPRTLDGLWKTCKRVWNAIPLPVLQRSLLQWKLRCRAIARCHGYQIEHDRWWRKGFS